jgi:RNA polymerase sigma factor (sigma-70 family)
MDGSADNLNREAASESDAARSDRPNQIRREAVLYYERLVCFLRKRGHPTADAQDLVQDAYVRFLASDVSKVRAVQSFLYKTVLNLVRDRARSNAVRSSVPYEADLPDDQPSAEQSLISKEALGILEKALQELSPKCRAVIVLYRFEKLSHREIADSLGMSVSMVEKYVRQAMDHCHMRLNEDRDTE